MNKKKKIIQLTEGILLCCVIVVMTLLCIGIIKKEVKNTKGKLTETTGWYRIQDNKKVQVDLNQKIKADPQGKLVLYNDTIAQKYKGYLMTTKAAKYSVRIYAGDQLIYQYSDSNFHLSVLCIEQVWNGLKTAPAPLMYFTFMPLFETV